MRKLQLQDWFEEIFFQTATMNFLNFYMRIKRKKISEGQFEEKS